MASLTPRHPQPFTLAQATQLPFETLTQEIARLQHSIQLLHSSQQALREHISSSDERDQELEQAVEENERAIQAQEERIGILHMAIALKGGAAHSAHYDVGHLGVGAAVGVGADVGGGPVTMNGRPVTFPLSPPVDDGSVGRRPGVGGGGGVQEEGVGIGSEDGEDEGVYL